MNSGRPHTHALPYRPCVGVALFNTEGLVFVGERLDTPGAWQMVQGGIDTDETVEQAAFRELHEETGSNAAEILKVADEKITYEIPDDVRANLSWGSRYRGQEQIWVAARFLGDDADFNIAHHDHPEFSAWQWVKLEETLDLIVPFKQDVYRRVISFFAEFSKD